VKIGTKNCPKINMFKKYTKIDPKKVKIGRSPKIDVRPPQPFSISKSSRK